MSLRRRVTSMGERSGAAVRKVEKRSSLDAAAKAVTSELYFVGVARGEEYTPLAGGDRICPVHGFGKLVVDGVLKFCNEYTVARFKFLRFARGLELGVFYKFTKFLKEDWKPAMLPIGAQTEMHSFYLSEFNLANELYTKLDTETCFEYHPEKMYKSLKEVVSFFVGVNPADYGNEKKPLVCSAFKVVASCPDAMVGRGLLRSSWKISDGTDTISYSVIGQNRARCSLEVGKEYKAYGCVLYFNGNSAPVMQPTTWSHLEVVAGESRFSDVATVESSDDVQKHFVVTMLKFVGIKMICAAADCRQLVDAASTSKFLVCEKCCCSFRPKPAEFQIELHLNGTEQEPFTTASGVLTVVRGPPVDNFKLVNYDLAQALFEDAHPEMLCRQPVKLQKASARVMKQIFQFTYNPDSLIITKVQKYPTVIPGLFSEDDESDQVDEEKTAKKKREKSNPPKSSKKSKEKTKKKRYSKKRRHGGRKGNRRSRRYSSTSSSTDDDSDNGSSRSSDASEASSTQSLRHRVKEKYGEVADLTKEKDDVLITTEEPDKQNATSDDVNASEPDKDEEKARQIEAERLDAERQEAEKRTAAAEAK